MDHDRFVEKMAEIEEYKKYKQLLRKSDDSARFYREIRNVPRLAKQLEKLTASLVTEIEE